MVRMQSETKLEAQRQWTKARSKAFWADLRANLERKNVNLLDFNDISQRLRLKNAIYRGIQHVPLDRIVGSVGRYHDFTSSFLPTSDRMRDRWQRVARLTLDPNRSLPPIEALKVGDWYFVRDGNHRVSVARQISAIDIDAEVWEYADPVIQVAPHAQIETLLIEGERQLFLEQTGLQTLRPQHAIRLSAPGGYSHMLSQIEQYRTVLSQIDGIDMLYEDAVTAWYDMVYETSVQIIERANILNLFPNRSAADFFIWCTNHHHELQSRYGKPLLMGDAVRDLKKRHPEAWLRWAWSTLRRRVPR
jgi:hypothetical protein